MEITLRLCILTKRLLPGFAGPDPPSWHNRASTRRSGNWKSPYSMKDLVPQRGSTSRASCFGVPYSEHSSFRNLTMFCTALRIERVILTVNVGSARSRETMKTWCERWTAEKKNNGFFR